MRGLELRDSIQLVTWLHGLPPTRAKDFPALIKDSPRAKVIHILEGCEQIALLIMVTLGYLPRRPSHMRTAELLGQSQLPFVLVFERERFPRLTYMIDLITHVHKISEDIPERNLICFDPIPHHGNESFPHRTLPQRTHHNHHHRPTVRRGILANVFGDN